MNILGLDTSTKTGWAFRKGNIYRCGVEAFPANAEQSDAMRLSKIRHWFRELMERAQPDHVIRERMFIPNSKSQGGKLLIKIEGVIDVECADHGIPIDVIPPSSLKKFFTGNGKASKEDMVRFANAFWLTKNPKSKGFDDDNIADAIACLKYGLEMLT